SALSPAVPGALLLAAGLALRLGHDRWPRVPHLLAIHGGELTTFAGGELLRWSQALLLLVPTASVLGVVYPALFRLDTFPEKGRAVAVGWMGALNALGCIAGALATGFFLVPGIGSEGTYLILTLLAVVAGTVLCLTERGGRRRLATLAAAALVVLLAG